MPGAEGREAAEDPATQDLPEIRDLQDPSLTSDP